MKATIRVTKEVEIKTLRVIATPRYWEDAEVNGVRDIEGTLIPCRDGENWKLDIDIDTGVIANWPDGVTARVHYKVCDAGEYRLLDEGGNTVLAKDGYVPSILNVGGESYGDYLIFKIGGDGGIADWNSKPSIKDFMDDED